MDGLIQSQAQVSNSSLERDHAVAPTLQAEGGKAQQDTMGQDGHWASLLPSCSRSPRLGNWTTVPNLLAVFQELPACKALSGVIRLKQSAGNLK